MHNDARAEVPVPSTPSATQKGRMPAALRALTVRLDGRFGGLSEGARERLAAACATFAWLIEATEERPEGSPNLRPWPRFLLSALFSLELTADGLPLSEDDEAWLVAEVEADLGEARALFQVHLGQPPTPVPPRPPLPVSQIIRP